MCYLSEAPIATHTCTHLRTHTPLDLYLGPQLINHLELLTKLHLQIGMTICPRGPFTNYSFSNFCGQNQSRLCSLLRPELCLPVYMLPRVVEISRPFLGRILATMYQISMDGSSRDPAGMLTEATACPLCTMSGTQNPHKVSEGSQMA